MPGVRRAGISSSSRSPRSSALSPRALTAEGARAGGDREHFRFPKTARITASEEIRSLFRRGKRRRTRHFDVFIASSPVPYPRLGLVVPRHKKKVVRRNQLKRRMREIGRIEMLPRLNAAGRSLDVMLRARPEAYGASFAELHDELVRLTEALCSSER